MNLYQKVVMRLIRAKTHDAEDIAQLTGMHINLVKLIQAELTVVAGLTPWQQR